MLHLVHPPQSVEARIRLAIANKRLVEVVLKCTASFGREAVGWRLFDVAKIESLEVLDTPFKGSRRTSDQDHHKWDLLYVRVDPNLR